MSQSNVPRIVFTENGLEAPETEAVLAAVRQDWKNALGQNLDVADDTPQGQLITTETAVITDKNTQFLTLANQFNPLSASGIWQDALGKIYFLDRKQAEPTIVTCQLTGLSGTVIPYGAIAQATTGHYFICNRSVTIGEGGAASGTAETTFRCAVPGPIAIPAQSVTRIVTVTPGWDTITNTAPGATGRDVESRLEFEERRYLSVAANAHGSVSAVFGSIANLPGVIDLQVLENVGPDPVTKFGVTVPGHGITVCVYGGEDAAIAEAIYRKKDAGCDTGGNTDVTYTEADYGNAVYIYRILRPTPVSFWVRVTVGRSTALTPEIIAAVKSAVIKDFLGKDEETGNARVGLASTVYASRFYCPALHVDGIKSLASIEIAFGNNAASLTYGDSVAIRGDQEPVMSQDTITVVREA